MKGGVQSALFLSEDSVAFEFEQREDWLLRLDKLPLSFALK